MTRLTGLVVAFLFVMLAAQPAHAIDDFNLTDTDGNAHNLYEYLQQDKIVVIKFFFVGCGSCADFAPHFDSYYQEFGSNNEDVTFLQLETTTQPDEDIIPWLNQLNSNAPAMGGAGAYIFWRDNMKNIVGNAFTQALVLRANNANPAASEVIYAEFGAGVNLNPAAIRDLINAELNSGTGLTEMADMFSLGPVPAYNNVTLSTAGLAAGSWQIAIIDLTGALIEERKITVHGHGEKYDFDLSNLAPGNYFFSLMNGQERWVQEISKSN